MPGWPEETAALRDPANLPAIIHCTAGKDRTGVAIALLLIWRHRSNIQNLLLWTEGKI